MIGAAELLGGVVSARRARDNETSARLARQMLDHTPELSPKLRARAALPLITALARRDGLPEAIAAAETALAPDLIGDPTLVTTVVRILAKSGSATIKAALCAL